MPLEMVWIPAGSFSMGSEDGYPEEAPVRRVDVDGFWIDRHPTTNADFRRFVTATGHVTIAERLPDPDDYPTIDPSLLLSGSLVFERPPRPVPLHDHRRWWRYVPDAYWHQPEGSGSSIEGRLDHPVVHVAFDDALAYASWAGKALPSEAEWEFAARGGIDGARYVWGDGPGPEGGELANTWQGEFPWQNLATDGYEGTSPVGMYPPNGHGLHDMAGNVWEWTTDIFQTVRSGESVPSCCVPTDIRGRQERRNSGQGKFGRRWRNLVLKGGSHLCAPNYCLRYRPAARQPQSEDTSACHVGFRCVVRS